LSFAATIEADAKVAHEEAGDVVIYLPAPGRNAGAGADTTISTFAMSVGEAMRLRAADEGRTVTQGLVISVPKADVISVSHKGDRVTVPGAWVGSEAATVDRRVASIDRDRTSPGSWVLRLDK